MIAAQVESYVASNAGSSEPDVVRETEFTDLVQEFHAAHLDVMRFPTDEDDALV